jgi:type IV secretion system protein VirB6
MPMPPIVAPLLVQVDAAVIGFYLAAAGRVAAATVNPFRTMVTIYILLWGLAFWRGLINEPLSDGVARLFRVVLIGTVALAAGIYGARVASFLYNTPGQLASTVMGGAVAPEAVMDASINKGNDIALAFMSLVSIVDIGGSIAAVLSALIVWLFTAVLVLYGTALILLSKVILGLVIAVGPLFIALLLFDSTKRFFEGWLGQALNYLFVYALVVAAINIMFALWAPQLQYALDNNSGGFKVLLPMIIVGGASFVILMQIPALASGLAGGVQLGTLGAVGWSFNKARGAIGMARPQNARAAYRSVRRDAMALRAGASMAAVPARWVAGRVRPGNSVSNASAPLTFPTVSRS